MAAKKLIIIDKSGSIPGLNFNVRYEKMDRAKKLNIDHVVEFLGPNGKVEYVTMVKNVPIFDQLANPVALDIVDSIPELTISVETEKPDATVVTCKKAWVDPAGNTYQPDQIKHYIHGQEYIEKTKSNIFEISSFQPLIKYNNDYVIDKYYEPWPDEDGLKKEADKDAARRKNLIGMRTLWEYLQNNQAVARGDFNVSSGGFQFTDGYIRAVGFGNKWGLEISILKEEKIFQHLQEGVPAAVMTAISSMGQPMRFKRV